MNIALLAKQSLIEQNQTLLASFKAKTPIEELVTQRCQFVDALVKQAWEQHGLREFDISLIAVGGYGRGELHPHSDVDLLFLFNDILSPAAEAALSQFIAFLWDANLEIGHSVRTLNDTITLGREDITIATNLLEARLLEGPEFLFDQLYDAIRQSDFWTSSDFFIAKRDEQNARHARASAFDLEPNIKSCPGGLRDIQTIAWVAMRHFGAARLEELVQYDFLETGELEELLECQHFLWKLRFALHMVVGRDENRLLFDVQRQVAELMGYEDATQLAVEQMMKRYYRTVRRVMELNEMLLQLFKRATLGHTKALEIQSIDKHYQRRGTFIEALSDDLFDSGEEIVRLFCWSLKTPTSKAFTRQHCVHCAVQDAPSRKPCKKTRFAAKPLWKFCAILAALLPCL